MHGFRPPGPNSAPWDDPLNIILHNFAKKYRPQYEGDEVLLELVHVNSDPSEAGNLLWKYRKRVTSRVNRQPDSIL